jgi:hypothetical protein
MKFIFIDTHYDRFLQECYQNCPNLSRQPYKQQLDHLLNQCFGTANFYTTNLERQGHTATKIIPNCTILQNKWLQEHHLTPSIPFTPHRPRPWQLAVLVEQIRHHRPDILYIHDLNWTDPTVLKSVRPYVQLIIGQNACPLSSHLDLSVYDLLLTSFPHYVTKFRSQGLSSEYFRIGFGRTVLDRLGTTPPTHNTTFVGGYSSHHRRRIQFLESIAQKVPVDFWGYGATGLPPNSAIRQRYHGESWGLDMYRTLAASRITLNLHIDVAREYANNMRLYEATGVGTCLVTDAKQNLGELFEPDREVVTYTSPEDCVEKIRYLLTHETTRSQIAQAGQVRTLREHTYFHRMQELVEIIERHLRTSSQSHLSPNPTQHQPSSQTLSLNQQAQTYLSQQQPKEALTTCHQAIKLEPKFHETYRLLGNVLESSGRIQQAQRAYTKAQELYHPRQDPSPSSP